jgi:pectin methylesterase-like acyl-CoA thioesterase
MSRYCRWEKRGQNKNALDLKQRKYQMSGHIKVISGIGKQILNNIAIKLNNRQRNKTESLIFHHLG